MSKASIYFTLSKVDGKHDGKRIKKTLDTLPGVESVSVNADSGCVAVDYDTTGVLGARIQKQLEKAGYQVRESHQERHVT